MILKPCYNFPKPNENTLLEQTKAFICVCGKSYEVDVEAHLRLLPSPRIEIDGVLPKSSGVLQFDSIEKIIIHDNEIPGFITHIPFPLLSCNSFVWSLRNEPTIARGSPETEMICVIFHIFNFNNFHGTRRSTEESATGSSSLYHIDLKFEEWQIEIKSMTNTSDILKILKEIGGFGLTHIGFLKKVDGSSFDGKTAIKLLNALRFFLSFSKGMWCHPSLSVGFDDKETRVWEAWSSPQGHWASPISWFDPHHCNQLVNLFTGFMTKWENENWQEALREVIYWYLSSNCSTLGRGLGIDAGIILTQAAIERLSFEYVVRYRRLIEESGFKDLRASDKFRMLFSSLDIPIDIPSSLPDLKKLAHQCNWIDAPHLITEIRNSLVHPVHKRKGQISKVFFSVWKLGQWYLELALLRICEYSGTYGNRLIHQRYVGEVESVPWEK